MIRSALLFMTMLVIFLFVVVGCAMAERAATVSELQTLRTELQSLHDAADPNDHETRSSLEHRLSQIDSALAELQASADNPHQAQSDLATEFIRTLPAPFNRIDGLVPLILLVIEEVRCRRAIRAAKSIINSIDVYRADVPIAKEQMRSPDVRAAMQSQLTSLARKLIKDESLVG